MNDPDQTRRGRLATTRDLVAIAYMGIGSLVALSASGRNYFWGLVGLVALAPTVFVHARHWTASEVAANNLQPIPWNEDPDRTSGSDSMGFLAERKR